MVDFVKDINAFTESQEAIEWIEKEYSKDIIHIPTVATKKEERPLKIYDAPLRGQPLPIMLGIKSGKPIFKRAVPVEIHPYLKNGKIIAAHIDLGEHEIVDTASGSLLKRFYKWATPVLYSGNKPKKWVFVKPTDYRVSEYGGVHYKSKDMPMYGEYLITEKVDKIILVDKETSARSCNNYFKSKGVTNFACVCPSKSFSSSLEPLKGKIVNIWCSNNDSGYLQSAKWVRELLEISSKTRVLSIKEEWRWENGYGPRQVDGGK